MVCLASILFVWQVAFTFVAAEDSTDGITPGELQSWVAMTRDGHGYTHSLERAGTTLNALTGRGNCSSPPSWGAQGPIRRLRCGIIGEDDRRRVNLTQVSEFPYRAIGQLEFIFEGKPGNCSGALYGPWHVLTAAHCVFDWESHRWHRNITFYTGRYDRETYRGHSTWHHAFVPSRYLAGGFVEDDMAVVILSENLGARHGWLGIASEDSIQKRISTVGYPVEKAKGTMWRTDCRLIRRDKDVKGRLWHDCDRAQGQSGSPMYSESHYVLATLVGGTCHTNVACDITEQRCLMLKSLLIY